MNDEFIVSNQDIADKVESKLKKQGIFSNIDQFILLFNQKFINTSKPEIKELSKLIPQAYENIILKNNHFYVTTKTEGALKNSLYVLEQWKLVLALKRIASSIIDDNDSEDVKVILDNKNPGIIYVEKVVDDDVKLEKYDNAEKITGSKTAIPSNPFIQSLIHDYGDDENKAYFVARDLKSIDTSFIDEVNDTVEKFVKNYEPAQRTDVEDKQDSSSDPTDEFSNADPDAFNKY